MPDLSADRPLLLPDAFTEEDVALVGDAIGSRSIARIALRVLGSAGRLLPSSAEHREEWNVRLPKPGGNSVVDDSMTKSWPPERGEIREDVAWWKENAGLDVTPVKRVVARFGDGSWLTGPWVEVDRSTDGV